MKIERFDLEENVDVTAYLREDYRIDRAAMKCPAVVICPGGGWFSLSEREGEPVALAFLNQGFQAFVLHYTIADFEKQEGKTENPDSPDIVTKALWDVERCIQLIREKTDEFGVDTNRILLLGFSAGAQLAAMYGNYFKSGISAVVLGYPLCDVKTIESYLKNSEVSEDNRKILEKVYILSKGADPIQHVNENTPPTFLWHTADDNLLPVINSLHYAEKLSEYNIPYELHIFEHGVHGQSLGREHSACLEAEMNPYCARWFDMMMKWFKERGLTND